jgi:serine phosphatase RsbU (regulator of sigma subunit)
MRPPEVPLASPGRPDDLAQPHLRLQALADVTTELMGADSVEAVSAVLTTHMMEAAGAAVAALSLLVDEHTLALVAIRGGQPGVANRWATYPLAGDNPTAEVVRTGRPLLLTDTEVEERYPELRGSVTPDRRVLTLPLAVGTRVLGAVNLSFPRSRELSEAEHLFYRMFANTCAITLDRIEAQRAAADREAKLAFLAETSATLAGALDYEATLSAVAEAAVPWFADWCAISLEDDGYLRTIAVAHNHPEHVELVRELQERWPTDPDQPRGSYQVLRTGVSEFAPEITDELLEMAAQDEEHLRLMKMLELRSGMSCALKVGDRSFGVITWIAGEEGRRFTEADLAFGEDLARRAAIAIDAAQLHTQLRDSALELQRAVLPERLPDLPGWDVAVAYRPAGRTDAGGDFYDVVPLGDGRIAMFVGDVMGRGVHAASVMAQMRSAIRTLVALDPSPSAVMSGMDRVFDGLQLDQLVTMVYAVADPATDRLAVINAGHPPPIVLRPDGVAHVLEHPSTLLLGVGGGDRAVLETDLRRGDRLLLYTDGLVERRGEDADVGTARLLEAFRTERLGTLHDTLSALVEEVRDPTRDDDVAALLVVRED